MYILLNLPISLTPDHTAGRLEQAVRTVPAHNLLGYASRALDLMAILAVKQLLRGIQREIGARRPRIESLFIFVVIRAQERFGLIGVVGFLRRLPGPPFLRRVRNGDIGARTRYEGVREGA